MTSSRGIISSIRSMDEGQLLYHESLLRIKNERGERFLGDNESLRNICEKDLAILAAANITSQQIGDKLSIIFIKATELLSRHLETNKRQSIAFYANGKMPRYVPVIDGKYKVFNTEVIQPFSRCCPFNTEETCGETNRCIIIENITNDQVIKVSELTIHLIRKHGFFEGLGSKYRLEPSQTCMTLELTPMQNYSNELQIQEHRRWEPLFSYPVVTKDYENILKEKCRAWWYISVLIQGYLLMSADIENSGGSQDNKNNEDFDSGSLNILQRGKSSISSINIREKLHLDSLAMHKDHYLHLVSRSTIPNLAHHVIKIHNGILHLTTAHKGITVYKLILTREIVLNVNDRLEKE